MQLINTGREAFFEDVVDHMAAICSAPVAIVTLTAARRQWVNARDGSKGHEAGEGELVFAHDLLGRAAAVVNDAGAPIRLLAPEADGQGPGILAYICIPLIIEGADVGNLYLADVAPRAWSKFETSYMERASRLVAGHFEARAALAERDRRIQLEHELAEAGALYQAVLASMQEGIIVQTAEGDIIASNAAAQQILGLSETELSRRTSAHPGWRIVDASGAPLPSAERPAGRVMAGGEPVIGFVMGVEKPDGDLRWLRVNSVPLATKAGAPRRVATTFSDITAELAQARELEQAVKAAEAASAAKSAFLANISHEIRTPLNGVMGMAQVLSHAALPGEQHAQVGVILESGRTLMALLNDVLDLSKIEAGRFDIVPSACRMLDILERQFALWRPRADEKGLTFTLDVSEDTPDWLSFDQTRVQQCLSNLISNAVKFTEPGGAVAIRAFASAASTNEVLVTIRVIDTGAGMDEATMARLFRPFTQADEAVASQYGGTGLGLSITRRLAELMGGEASVVSAPGKGSAFSISFRARRVAQDDGDAASEVLRIEETEKAEGLRVLLVDDHPVNRMVATIFLQVCADHIVTAENGVEALEALAREAFDVVLLDMHMPVMDGPATIRRIRASGATWADVPVIALTADAMAGDRERYLALGLDGYVTKPLDERTMLSEVVRHARSPRRDKVAVAS